MKKQQPIHSFVFLIFLIFAGFLFARHSSGAEMEPFLKKRVSFVAEVTHDEEGKDLTYPSFLWVDLGKKEIYLVEGHGKILVYNEKLFPLFTLAKEHGIESAQAVMVDAGGYLWVAQAPTPDDKKGRISVLDRRLNWKKNIYFNNFKFKGAENFVPYRMAENSRGQIFVVGSYSPAVVVLDTFGNFEDAFFHESKVEGGRKQVTFNDVIVGSDDRIYLLSEETSHVYIYDAARKFLTEFGQKGGSTGKMSRPQGFTIDKRTGNFLIVDYMRHAVSVFNGKGEFIFEFGGLGWGEGWFQYPKDIASDENGRIYVADTFNSRIQVFQLLGPEIAAEQGGAQDAAGKRLPGQDLNVEEIERGSKQSPSIPPIQLDKKRPQD